MEDEIEDGAEVEEGDPFAELDNLDAIETTDDDHDEVAAAAAELEAYFGPLDGDDEAEADEPEAGEADEDEPEAEAEAAAVPPAQAAAAAAAPAAAATEEEEPAQRYDDEGHLLDENDVPLNHLGLPHITDDEWAEYLADPNIPAGEAQREYTKYLTEYSRREAVHSVQIQEVRRAEIEATASGINDMFGEGEAVNTHVAAEVAKIMAHVPEHQRMNPGYHEWAARLVLARDMPMLFKQHGINAAFLAENNGQTETAQPAAPTGAGRRLVRASGGATPPPAARATGSRAPGSSLSAEEKAMAKEFGMTNEEYEKYK